MSNIGVLVFPGGRMQVVQVASGAPSTTWQDAEGHWSGGPVPFPPGGAPVYVELPACAGAVGVPLAYATQHLDGGPIVQFAPQSVAAGPGPQFQQTVLEAVQGSYILDFSVALLPDGEIGLFATREDGNINHLRFCKQRAQNAPGCTDWVPFNHTQDVNSNGVRALTLPSDAVQLWSLTADTPPELINCQTSDGTHWSQWKVIDATGPNGAVRPQLDRVGCALGAKTFPFPPNDAPIPFPQAITLVATDPTGLLWNASVFVDDSGAVAGGTTVTWTNLAPPLPGMVAQHLTVIARPEAQGSAQVFVWFDGNPINLWTCNQEYVQGLAPAPVWRWSTWTPIPT